MGKGETILIIRNQQENVAFDFTEVGNRNRSQNTVKLSTHSFQNGKAIDFDEYSMAEDGRVRVRSSDNALIIENTRISDSGNYTCHATNGWGTDVEAPAKLDILEKMEVLAMPESAALVDGRDYTLDCLVKVS